MLPRIDIIQMISSVHIEAMEINLKIKIVSISGGKSFGCYVRVDRKLKHGI